MLFFQTVPDLTVGTVRGLTFSACTEGRRPPSEGGSSMNTAQKQAIHEMRHQQLGYTQIAKELDLSVNTVKSYCFRNGLSTDALVSNATLCRNCGKVITEKSRTRPRKFCCPQCKRAWWNAHRCERASSKLTTYVCETCGKSFSDYGNTHRKFCSQACYRERGDRNDQ